jgi:hypothetical protein
MTRRALSLGRWEGTGADNLRVMQDRDKLSSYLKRRKQKWGLRVGVGLFVDDTYEEIVSIYGRGNSCTCYVSYNL